MRRVDRKFMQLAIEQAREQLRRYGLGERERRPNPLVGCVIVLKNGEYHVGYRGEIPGKVNDHAEFTVMTKIGDEVALTGATVYTTLEPCTERTPPKRACADRLIERQVARVVVGLMDPDGKGQGSRKLMEAGISVDIKVDQDLKDEIKELNRAFIRSRTSMAPEAANSDMGISPGQVFPEHTRSAGNPASILEIRSAFDYLVENRRICAKLAKVYHTEVDTHPEIPLIVLNGGFPDHPLPLRDVEARLILLESKGDKPPPDAPPMSFDGLVNTKDKTRRTLFHYRSHQLKTLAAKLPTTGDSSDYPEEPLWNGHSFRLVDVSFDGQTPAFICSLTDYAKFFDTCKALEIEVAIWARRHAVPGGVTRPKLSGADLPLRGEPRRVTNYLARNMVPGINCLVVCHREFKPGSFSFFLIERNRLLAQAEGSVDVVPAGAFQPDDHITDVNKEFSLFWNIIREFRQEMIGEPSRKGVPALKRDAMRRARIAELQRQASFALENSTGVTFHYLGFGFDPLGLYPEILTLMLCDEAYPELGDLFSNLRGSFEGSIVEKRFDQATLATLAQDPRMAPSGEASLRLAAKYYRAIVNGEL